MKLPQIDCFTSKKQDDPIPVIGLTAAQFSKRVQDKEYLKLYNFKGQQGEVVFVFGAKNRLVRVYYGCSNNLSRYDIAAVAHKLQALNTETLVFILKGISDSKLVEALIGWGIAHNDDHYKKDRNTKNVIVYALEKDIQQAIPYIESINFLKKLVNAPANKLGPEELECAVKELTVRHAGTKLNVVKGKALEDGFPMIHEVGKASTRPPRYIQLNWGHLKHPKVTIVGKGIIFDTGGLDIKPSRFMRDMKKDMGGAAHAIALAHLIMSQKLPVRLTLALSVAENSVAGNAFRPGDVIKSRKGLSVEIGNTDAEGRLVVGDALTCVTEDEKTRPELLIDFCTLTGAARIATGNDISPFFTHSADTEQKLRKIGQENHDPVWPLPLFSGYRKELDSPLADICNDGAGRAGATHGALFLQEFIHGNVHQNAPEWIHFDVYAWSNNNKPGRQKGGADTGLLTAFQFIKNKYD